VILDEIMIDPPYGKADVRQLRQGVKPDFTDRVVKMVSGGPLVTHGLTNAEPVVSHSSTGGERNSGQRGKDSRGQAERAFQGAALGTCIEESLGSHSGLGAGWLSSQHIPTPPYLEIRMHVMTSGCLLWLPPGAAASLGAWLRVCWSR
jgi:hypothetical protein